MTLQIPVGLSAISRLLLAMSVGTSLKTGRTSLKAVGTLLMSVRSLLKLYLSSLMAVGAALMTGMLFKRKGLISWLLEGHFEMYFAAYGISLHAYNLSRLVQVIISSINNSTYGREENRR